MAFLVGIIVIGFIIWAIVSMKRDEDISKNGIETEAVVSRVEEHSSINEDKKSDNYKEKEYTYTYYVKYQNQKGETIEAKLGPQPHTLQQGNRIRIKYSMKNPSYVLSAEE